jgi:hypothetical protein
VSDAWRRSRLTPAAVYLFLALAWTWPLPLYLSKRFAHDPGDPLLQTFLLWWNARVIPLSEAMWSPPIYWPMRDALALTDHVAGMSVVSSPIQWLGGSALLAYNVLLIGSGWWSALAAHALVRRLTASEAAAYCAGLAYGFAPYRASQLAHIQLLTAWWMPLALLALHAYYQDGRRRWLALFGVSWLMQALTNGYYLFFFPVLLGLWVIVFTPWRERPRRALTVAATWILFSLPLIPVLLKYYTVQNALALGRTRTEMRLFSANWTSFLNPAPLLRFWPERQVQTQEDYLFPGLFVILLVVGGGVAVWRRRITGVGRPFAFYVAAALLMAWMAFGPALEQRSLETAWRAYGWIAWLPGFSGLRVPARFFMLATLCLAVAAGLAMAAIAAAWPRRATAIGVVAALGLLSDGWIGAMPLGAPPRPFGVETAANGRVLELPMTDDNVNVAAMYRSMLHGMPVVNGYAGYVPPHAVVIDWALRRHDPSILTELRRGHPLYVAVANTSEAQMWTAFMDAQHDAQLLGVSGAGRLYMLPPSGYPRQTMLGARLTAVRVESGGGWLTADLGTVHTIRAVTLRTRGHVVLLRQTVRVETSVDGLTWTLGADEPPGGLALVGALAEPLAVPLRIVLPDARARYLRINTTAFFPDAITLYGPA